MTDVFRLCPRCSRHLKPSEERCPFCARSLADVAGFGGAVITAALMSCCGAYGGPPSPVSPDQPSTSPDSSCPSENPTCEKTKVDPTNVNVAPPYGPAPPHVDVNAVEAYGPPPRPSASVAPKPAPTPNIAPAYGPPPHKR